MKPADSSRDYHELVRQTYDRIAADYNRGRLEEFGDRRVLAPLFEGLPPGSQVLDLGCGAGVPMTQALAERYEVTGIDVSAEQIKLARQQVPNARFVQSDMTHLDFSAETFDAVVSFFAIFHLPREEQPKLFGDIFDWLKPGGFFLATLALEDEPGYTEDDFHGDEMYWSNFSREQYRSLLTDAGFELIDDYLLIDDPALTASPETHPVFLARRPKNY